MLTLESDQEYIAYLGHCNIIGIRFGWSPGLPIEIRVDVGRSAVRVQDRADRLEHIQCGCIVFDRFAGIQNELAKFIFYHKVECKGAFRNVRVNSDCLDIIDTGVDQRTIAYGTGYHVNRSIRIWNQSGCLPRLGPVHLGKVDTTVVSNECNSIGHVIVGSDSFDHNVVECVKRLETLLNFNIFHVVSQRAYRIAFTTCYVLSIELRDKFLSIATYNDQHLAFDCCRISRHGEGELNRFSSIKFNDPVIALYRRTSQSYLNRS